jgi:membrane protease YdiL (CAAX protease family)
MTSPPACPSLPEAVLTSVVTTAVYVGVLYLPVNAGERDEKGTIISRIVSVALVTLAGEIYIHIRLPSYSFLASHQSKSLSVSHTFATIISGVAPATTGVLLTFLLYAGHFAARTDPDVATPRETISLLSPASRYIALRNLIAAPVVEEIVFRRQALLLWRCTPGSARIYGPAVLFSLAHAHHALTMGLPVVLLQCAYTALFGMYAACLTVATGSVSAAIAAHGLCNRIGLPDFEAIANHPRVRAIIALYASALVLLAYAFSPLTHWARNALEHPHSPAIAVVISQLMAMFAPEMMGSATLAQRRWLQPAGLLQLLGIGVLCVALGFQKVTAWAEDTFEWLLASSALSSQSSIMLPKS